jgi:hypothetical protein
VAAALLVAAGAPAPGAREAAPKVRLEFDVRTTQLAEVAARAQARLDAFGATEARAMQEGSRLVVELPPSLISKRSEIEALLTRPHVLAFTIVENNSLLMIDLYGRLGQDRRSHELGIFRDIGQWQHADATHAIESDPFLEGQRAPLERYLAGLEVGHRPDGDHDFSLSPVPERPKLWRTEYVDLKTRVRITRVLEATVEKSNLQSGDIELALRMLPGDGERLRALTRGHLGKKMVITVDGEVLSTPVIEGAVGDRGRMTMSDEPLARRLAAALLAGPLLGELTADKPSPAEPVVGLGNLNVIGLGGPDPHCEPIPESPTLSVSVSRSVPTPAVREICEALRALGPKIEACHLETLHVLPFTAHTLSLELSVGKHRKVERVTVDERAPWHYGSPLGPCLAHAMRRLKFARPLEWEREIDLWIHFAAPESQ